MRETVEPDVLTQIIVQLAAAGVERTLCSACTLRRHEAIGPPPQHFQALAVAVMLRAHATCHERRAASTAGEQDREEHPFFPSHVMLKLAEHLGKDVRKARRTFRMISVHGLHFAREPNKLRQLAPMDRVKAFLHASN